MFCLRNDEYPAQIDRCGTYCQFARMKDLWPMFSPGKQICHPLASRMKDRDIDHRLWTFAGRLCEQFDGAIDSIDQGRSISTAKQEHISCVVRNGDAGQSGGILLDWKQCSRAR